MINATGFELDRAAWIGRAACAGMNTKMFFPRPDEALVDARTICAGCPVREPCLDFALRWRIRHGIWGGFSERERRRIIDKPARPRRVAPHGTTTRYARGCHCPSCGQANTLAKRRWRNI